MLDQEQCWQAVKSKGAAFDGQFFFSVLTTRVYCRPSCPSRLPLRKNVRFYETPKEAEAEGLRACLRCRPLAAVGADPAEQRIRNTCRFIEQNISERLTLSALSNQAHMGPCNFRRAWNKNLGSWVAFCL
jgi:AraC family transcriptional regulator, regulatory protein of adaptative response / methylated-DNA-[protein]-cysteine methyltransferase